MDENTEFQCTLHDIEQSYRAALLAFAQWFAREWKITREEWVESHEGAPPSDDWFAGQNVGVESVLAALNMFLDEVWYG